MVAGAHCMQQLRELVIRDLWYHASNLTLIQPAKFVQVSIMVVLIKSPQATNFIIYSCILNASDNIHISNASSKLFFFFFFEPSDEMLYIN